LGMPQRRPAQVGAQAKQTGDGGSVVVRAGNVAVAFVAEKLEDGECMQAGAEPHKPAQSRISRRARRAPAARADCASAIPSKVVGHVVSCYACKHHYLSERSAPTSGSPWKLDCARPPALPLAAARCC